MDTNYASYHQHPKYLKLIKALQNVRRVSDKSGKERVGKQVKAFIYEYKQAERDNDSMSYSSSNRKGKKGK